MKKFFAVVAVATLSLGAVSCGEKTEEALVEASVVYSTAVAVDSTAVVADSTAVVADSAAVAAPAADSTAVAK